MNEDLEDAMNQDGREEELYYRLHRGLVKIQACWRGYIGRKRVKKLLKLRRTLLTDNV